MCKAIAYRLDSLMIVLTQQGRCYTQLGFYRKRSALRSIEIQAADYVSSLGVYIISVKPTGLFSNFLIGMRF